MPPYEDKGPLDCTIDIDRSCLKGKTAIVTGGSNGIGEGYVRALTKAGAFAVIADVDEIRGQALASELEGAQFIHCDVANWQSQLGMFKQAIASSPTKRIDIVIANAGIAAADSIFEFEEKEDPTEPSLKTLNINLTGAILTSKLALHYFRRQYASQPDQDTSLIFQGSMGGYIEGPGKLEYCASKFGLRGLMRSLRRTAWMHGTRVNYIAPAFIKTNIIGDVAAQFLTAAGVSFATIEDAVAALMRVLCDDTATGRTIAVLARDILPQGFVDLNQDDFPEGSPLRVMQDRSLALAGRRN